MAQSRIMEEGIQAWNVTPHCSKTEKGLGGIWGCKSWQLLPKESSFFKYFKYIKYPLLRRLRFWKEVWKKFKNTWIFERLFKMVLVKILKQAKNETFFCFSRFGLGDEPISVLKVFWCLKCFTNFSGNNCWWIINWNEEFLGLTECSWTN